MCLCVFEVYLCSVAPPISDSHHDPQLKQQCVLTQVMKVLYKCLIMQTEGIIRGEEVTQINRLKIEGDGKFM